VTPTTMLINGKARLSLVKDYNEKTR